MAQPHKRVYAAFTGDIAGTSVPNDGWGGSMLQDTTEPLQHRPLFSRPRVIVGLVHRRQRR